MKIATKPQIAYIIIIIIVVVVVAVVTKWHYHVIDIAGTPYKIRKDKSVVQQSYEAINMLTVARNIEIIGPSENIIAFTARSSEAQLNKVKQFKMFGRILIEIND